LLKDVPRNEMEELTSYPVYVYLGIAEMAIWNEEDDEDEDDEDVKEDEDMDCPVCHGQGVLLGKMGNLTHYRCRQCGMQFSSGEK